MTVFRTADAHAFSTHGSTFESVVRTEQGSRELCAWRLRVPPASIGVPHKPSHEEVLLVLAGRLDVEIDGVADYAEAGDVVLVPALAELRVSGGPDGATAWVTTTAGLTATTADGDPLAPPWAQ